MTTCDTQLCANGENFNSANLVCANFYKCIDHVFFYIVTYRKCTNAHFALFLGRRVSNHCETMLRSANSGFLYRSPTAFVVILS